MRLKDTNEMFADDLRDPAYAAGYLNTALEDDGMEGFLYALQKVARARGIRQVAADSDIPRESLYRALSEKGNPGVKPLARVLDSLGLRLTVTPIGPETGAPVGAPQTREEPRDARQATWELQEEARRTLAQIQHLATALTERMSHEAASPAPAVSTPQ